MRRFSNYGPSLIVLLTAAVVLFAGPYAVREITYHRNQAQIQQASLRLACWSNSTRPIETSPPGWSRPWFTSAPSSAA